MFPARVAFIFLAIASGLGLSERVSAQAGVAEEQMSAGSPAFCLYELPADSGGRKRWINLAIVQYVETTHDELKIVFGGGNLGSGYEARVPIANPDDASLQLQKMMDRAALCN